MKAPDTKAKENRHLRALMDSVGQPLLAIFTGLAIGGIIIGLMGENVFSIYATLFKGGFGSPYYFMSTLTRATPVIFCGLGAALAWRAGLINIGGEGQMIAGAVTTVAVGVNLPFGGVLGALVCLLAGALVGGLYALLAAWLEVRFGVLLLITTLMMNYIADYVAFYLLSFPLKDTAGDAFAVKTLAVPESMWIPQMKLVSGSTLHYGIVAALVLMGVMVFVNRKTVFGYESRMAGLNAEFANYGGIRQNKLILLAMSFSGAICGLGGSVEVLGAKHAYLHGMVTSSSFAWTGLMAALIANLNPVGTVVCAIFLAGIQTGGAMLERATSVPLEISMVIQAVITLLVSAKLLVRFARRRKPKAGQESGVAQQ